MRKYQLILLTVLLVLITPNIGFCDKKSDLETLVRQFEQNPSDADNTIRLLRELRKTGGNGQRYIDRYFQTQRESDYYKEQNWIIVRDFVTDYNAPQFKYVFHNRNKFLQLYSKDDVFQKLDNVLVSHLERLYRQSRPDYEKTLQSLKDVGYAHYDVLCDYFNIRSILASRNAEDYFYKARKLFRYFPENREMIKEITAGALEIMHDVSRLKVIQLWAGKTVESKLDFSAICNYVKISQKCGFTDVARKYAEIAGKLAEQSDDYRMKQQVGELFKLMK